MTFVMTGCDNDDDDKVIVPDMALFAGNWEVVDQGNQQVFERNCILEITSTQIHEGYGGYKGDITTYFLTVDGTPLYDRGFTWTSTEVENHQPLLELVCLGELDGADPVAGEYSYRITKLTSTDMWWQSATKADKTVIKFRRNSTQK